MVIEVIFLLVIILVSMTLHEAMHAYVGYWLGDDTAKEQGRLTLNPIPHIDPFMTILLPVILMLTGGPIFGGAKPVPFNPNRVRYGEFGAMLVGIAGPLTNLLLAVILFGVYALTGVEGDVGKFFILAILVNLGFFVFNILPIPPLDGSRLLYYLAPDGARRVMESMEQYGIFIILLLVLFFGQIFGSYMQATIQFLLQALAFLFSR